MLWSYTEFMEKLDKFIGSTFSNGSVQHLEHDEDVEEYKCSALFENCFPPCVTIGPYVTGR